MKTVRAGGSQPLPVGAPGHATSTIHVLAVEVGGMRCGFVAEDVVGVHRAARPQPLPGAPLMVEGMLNVRGEIVPLLDLRRRLGLPAGPLRASHHLVVLRSGGLLAVRVDRAQAILAMPADALREAPREGGDVPAHGVARLPDGLLLIYDPARFLSLAEADALDAALSTATFGDSDG
jgi:purine-binding chemotaxis protein CheW